eukprot:1161229-Pelagomonas_calceolata.AAC.3
MARFAVDTPLELWAAAQSRHGHGGQRHGYGVQRCRGRVRGGSCFNHDRPSMHSPPRAVHGLDGLNGMQSAYVDEPTSDSTLPDLRVGAHEQGGYITTGSDGLNVDAPGSLAALPILDPLAHGDGLAHAPTVSQVDVPMPGGYITTGSKFEWHVDAPMPGGYITTGSDGLDWGAPGSLAAMPMLATSAAPHGAPPSLSVSGSAAHWQAHPQQQLAFNPHASSALA